ncbi:MAG: capsule assembly Wzi family protein [Balneolaceae bacterium]
MLKKTLSITLFVLFLGSSYSFGQASLVPVYHQVYDWMHYQRIRGNAPFYNYEALPLTRGQITSVLNQIDESDINQKDKHVLRSYLREFSVDSLRNYETNSFIQGSGRFYNRAKDLIFSDEEPHLYVWDDKHATIAFDWFPGRGAVFVEDGDQSFSAPYYTYGGIRSYGTLSNVIGYHYEQWRAVQVGDDEAFRYLPFLSRNWKFITGEFFNKHHLEAFAGFHKNYWSLHIGRGTLKYGVGSRNNLVYSREGIPFDWIRLNINSKYFKYSMIQGSLSWETRTKELEGYPGTFTRISPSRYTLHQRLQFQPAKWISFGFYELINYSNREIEIPYLNPVNRLSIAEWEQQDQDNGFAGIEGVLRPIRGLELYGEILIDDLGDSDDIFKWEKRNASNSTFARYLGIKYALKTGTVLNIDYQRIEASLYAHKLPLNAHSEKGIGLGSQVGPNGDELSIGIEQWLSHRTRISLQYDYNRHGLNYFDENGIFIDAGGDINESYTIDPETGDNIRPSEFLGGDLHRWNRYNIEASYEPWRGFKLAAEYSFRSMLEGGQLLDLSVFNFTLLIGY